MRVLFLGDGNCSLSAAVARALAESVSSLNRIEDGIDIDIDKNEQHVVAATTLEDESGLKASHPDAQAILVRAQRDLRQRSKDGRKKRRKIRFFEEEEEKERKSSTKGEAVDSSCSGSGSDSDSEKDSVIDVGRLINAGGQSVKFIWCGGVDATQDIIAALRKGLDKQPADQATAVFGTRRQALFDHAVFHFPHVGREDQHAHRRLLCHALASLRRSCSAYLSTGTADDVAVAAAVHITVSRLQAVRWDLIGCAERAGWKLAGSTLWDDKLAPGYEPRRNVRRRGFKKRVLQGHPGTGFDTADTNACVCTTFVLPSSVDPTRDSSWLPPWSGRPFPVEVVENTERPTWPCTPASSCSVAPDVETTCVSDAEQQNGINKTLLPDWAKPKDAPFWPPWPRPPEFPPDEQMALTTIECPMCGYFFADAEAYEAHCKNQSADIAALKCSKCSRVFHEARALTQHQQHCQ